MQSDMEALQRERVAHNKIAPLLGQIARAFYRFPRTILGPPNRLHVSPEIHRQLRNVCEERQRAFSEEATAGTLYFRQCPVIEIADLDGFRWVREQPIECETKEPNQ
jgi:hypothetical protein